MALRFNNEMRMEGDHDHHGGSDVCGGMGMRMTFHGGYCETLLFDQWRIVSVAGMVGSCIAVFVMAALYELLRQYREHRWATEPVPNTTKNMMLRRSHFYQTLLHMVQFTLGYSVMLIIMSFNYWLMLSVLLGGLSGYLLGKMYWTRPRQVPDSVSGPHVH